MSESYTPTGATAAAITRFTSAEAATGTFGAMHRTWQTEIADRTRFLDTTGLISFPATQVANAGANVLDDYEEGTWTPTDASGAGLTLSAPTGVYEKFGRLVIARGHVTYPATADGSSATIGGLPFTTGTGTANRNGYRGFSTETTAASILPGAAATSLIVIDTAGSPITNATMSTDQIIFTAIYHV